ncbi:D-aminoacyl-tRNA deacylase [Fidelibacter multiformis]|jgi:D-tyrosyl-tRNA(Tyr) deacylase|uniref:D-aminoacyl-tRNA deacylase n=1 Tax=Fidelibacter multiformis TaxID=3377529 RepID=UPI0037DD9FFF
MIAVLQRVSRASVRIGGEETGRIGTGLMILLGVVADDQKQDADYLAEKISRFRIFGDEENRMNRDILEIGGACLVVSQFTLCADWLKGRRPGFTKAAPPEKGEELYEYFCERLRRSGIPVETGRFGAMMSVALVNEGPVTFILDSEKKFQRHINK